jgi:drug/metabolite transporter (DMT)-like permease
VQPRARHTAFILMAATVWGSSFIAIKLGLAGAPPVTSVLLRFAIAAAASTVILRAIAPLRLSVLKDPYVVAISLANAGGFALQYLGLADTNSAVAALLANVGVVVVAVLAATWLHERISGPVAVAVALTLVGGTLLATRGDYSQLGTPEFRAAVLIASASVIWSLFVVMNKAALDRGRASEAELTWGVLLLSVVWLVPATLLVEGVPTFAYPPVVWWVALYTGVVCSSLSYVIYMVGLKGLGATVTSVITVAEILVAFVLTAIVFGYVVSGVAAVGAGLVLGGIALAGLQRPRPEPVPDAPAPTAQEQAKAR